MEYCHDTGKVMYPSAREARLALRKTEGRDCDGRQRSTYKCDYCHRYHFGQHPTASRDFKLHILPRRKTCSRNVPHQPDAVWTLPPAWDAIVLRTRPPHRLRGGLDP